MTKFEMLINKAYSAFNSRDINGALALMDQEVKWPKAFEGDYVQGHKAIREYWTRQWSEINPIVTPAKITERADGRIDVEVDQVVKDLDGALLFDGKTRHVYTLRNGLIAVMDLEPV